MDTQVIGQDGIETPTEEPSQEAELGFWGRLKKKTKEYFTYNVPGHNLRVWELDLIRGIIMIFVTFDHIARFSYYWGIIHFQTPFGQAIGRGAVAYLTNDFIQNSYAFWLWVICFMSGISCQFSHSSVMRVIKFWIFSFVFMGGYLALHFVMPDRLTGYLIFNIVAVLTISVTVWYLMEKLKLPDWWRIAIASAIIVTGVALYFYSRFHDGGLYVDNGLLALLVYNQHGYQLSPNNFEPLLPHLGFFILGAVYGKHVYKDKKTVLKRSTPPKWLSPVMILGKHSLAAYLFLPTVSIALLWVVVQFVGLFV